ncbi:hypothetical protein [Asticcacaulis sp. 201]|uniref:hypothetical protein n=1 Tax=Asticcacaulis sp. 201 TaxID=3028787 RepID=UPI002915D133|nr:hypothetical protein [Asticcacaulis sp. 201]MDV6332248.1 hypothetical protein [Asticcacaulis sp. 201]
MFWVSRIFELLSATKKLNTAKAHVMSAVSGLTLVLLLGIFGTFLSALMIGGLLWLIYMQLIAANLDVLPSCAVIAALTLVILGVAAAVAARIFNRVRSDVEQIFHSQAPMVAPVIDKATNMVGAFVQGLRTSRSLSPKDKLERARR